MPTPALARQWLVTEADNWLAALRIASQEHRNDAVVSLAECMNGFNETWSDWGHWTEVFTLAGNAAEELGDATAIATHMNFLSWALNVCDGDIPAAAAAAQRAYVAAEFAGDLHQQSWARFYLVAAQFAAGEYSAASASALDAYRFSQHTGDRQDQSRALYMVARGFEHLGRIDEAIEAHRQQLRFVNDPATAVRPDVASAIELFSRASMGRLYNDRGEWDAAVNVLRPAVPLADVISIPRMHAIALAALGQSLCETQQRAEGREHLRAAHALYERLNNGAENSRVRALLDQYATD